jgi:hypothetical protein
MTTSPTSVTSMTSRLSADRLTRLHDIMAAHVERETEIALDFLTGAYAAILD